MVKQMVDTVQMDALAALKIIRHCQESLPRLAAGQLLGLDVESTLEVTNCFAFPFEEEEEEDAFMLGKYKKYQRRNTMREMLGEGVGDLDDFTAKTMHFLKLVNVDANAVGWYTTSIIGSNLTQSITTQFKYQTANAAAVLVVYDPLRTRKGSICLRAFQLTETFMAAFKARDFTVDALLDSGLSFRDIYAELPIVIYNSPLVNAFLLEMDAQFQDVSSVGFDRFDLESAVYLEKNMEYLLSAIDTFNYSQSHYIYFKKRLAHRDEALARRRAENEARVADGLKPLPESDIYKRFGSNLPDISSRLESLLVSSNVDNYCLQLNSFVEQAITRVYTTEAIQK